jgi:hypothetical protein
VRSGTNRTESAIEKKGNNYPKEEREVTCGRGNLNKRAVGTPGGKRGKEPTEVASMREKGKRYPKEKEISCQQEKCQREQVCWRRGRPVSSMIRSSTWSTL